MLFFLGVFFFIVLFWSKWIRSYYKSLQQKQHVIEYCIEDDKPVHIYFQGAGNYIRFYVGVAEELQRWYAENVPFVVQGSSSGAVVAVCLAAELSASEITTAMETYLNQFKFSLWKPWEIFRNVRKAHRHIQYLLKKRLTNEHLPKLQNRLRIVAFDWKTFRPVIKQSWDSVDQVVQWVCASTYVPFVLGLFPLVMDGCWLTDAMSLDWILGFWKKPKGTKIIRVSVFDSSSSIHPTPILSPYGALFALTPEQCIFLVNQGREECKSYIHRHRTELLLHPSSHDISKSLISKTLQMSLNHQKRKTNARFSVA